MWTIGQSAVRVGRRDARVSVAEGDDGSADAAEAAHQRQRIGDQRDVLREPGHLPGLSITPHCVHNVPPESRIA